MKYTAADLENLLNEKINSCQGLPEVCAIIQTPQGRQRVKERLLQILTNDGISDIDAALAQIESQLTMEE